MSNEVVSEGSKNDAPKSELSNPYFLHHSDHPGLVLVSKPLNGDIYSTWLRAMTIALNAKNKLGFVNGVIKSPSEKKYPDDYAIWSRCNDMVHSWIINTIAPKISDSVIFYPTACEVWEDLRERFSQSNAPRIFEIQREIAYHQQEQLSISAYYTKLKSLWDELASYIDASSCTCGAQQDRKKLMQFLMGLNESYTAARGQILLMNPLPSVRQAYAVVYQEEKQRHLGTTHTAADSHNGAAMAVRNNRPSNYGPQRRMEQRSDQSLNNSQGGRQSDQDRRRLGSSEGHPECTHCGDMGHFVETCYKLIGYPPGHPKANRPKTDRSRSSANQVSNGVTKDEEESLLSTISETQQLQQLVSLLNAKEKEFANPQANSTISKAGLSKLSSRGWIFDSGATDHIVSSHDLLCKNKKKFFIAARIITKWT